MLIPSGMQIVGTSRVDPKKTFVVGVALVFGLSLDILPVLYSGIPAWLHPLFGSSLTLATVVAVVLNQLLRLRSESAG